MIASVHEVHVLVYEGDEASTTTCGSVLSDSGEVVKSRCFVMGLEFSFL